MNIKLDLTDDELSLIQTSLQLTMKSHERYTQVKGEKGLDFQTKQAFKEMKELYERLNKEYF